MVRNVPPGQPDGVGGHGQVVAEQDQVGRARWPRRCRSRWPARWSAAASAGASFTPSPTMATAVARARRSAMTSALFPAGSVPAMTSSHPDRGGHGPGGGLVVPGEQDRRAGQRPRSAATAGRPTACTVSITARAPPDLAVPGDQDRGAAAAPSQAWQAAVRPAGTGQARGSRQQSARPTMTSRPSTRPWPPGRAGPGSRSARGRAAVSGGNGGGR